MYCMPQEGTEAYLYFPEAEEESAYAVSEIHNSRCPVFADAQRRELVTEHGKKLRLHADMLGFAGGKEETVQECRMREDGIHFGAGRGKLQVTGREQILFHAPEISLDAVQKIGQYKMESMAKEKAGMLYPRGGGNPATGGLAAAALGVTAVQLGMTAGVLTAGAGIAAVAATASSDRKNGTESSLGDYISNAFSASARVGASCIAITLGMYGAEVMTLTVSGGMGLIPVGGTVVTLPQLAGAFQLVAGIVTSQNLLFQMRGVLMFCISGKEMGAPTGNWLYDSARELTEMASMQFAVYGLMNPYTYQRPKITPLPNETGLTVPGGTGVAVVPNGTAPALKQPYLPGQYSEYPAAVQGWAQQALPGGGSAIEGGSVPVFYVGPNGKELPSQYKDWIGTNIQKELLEQAENLQLQNAIKQLYRGNSFIGDGGTADVIRFEQQTGLMLGKNGGSHVQKGIDMAKYIENKILTQDLSPSDRALAIQLLEDLYSALGR